MQTENLKYISMRFKGIFTQAISNEAQRKGDERKGTELERKGMNLLKATIKRDNTVFLEYIPRVVKQISKTCKPYLPPIVLLIQPLVYIYWCNYSLSFIWYHKSNFAGCQFGNRDCSSGLPRRFVSSQQEDLYNFAGTTDLSSNFNSLNRTQERTCQIGKMWLISEIDNVSFRIVFW